MIPDFTISTQRQTAKTRPQARILIADQDIAIRRLLKSTFVKQGYQVYEHQNFDDIFSALHRIKPDVLIIDPDLTSGDASLISHIRARWGRLPILVLSEHRNDALTVRVLDEGADDFVLKPFGVEELSARVRAAIRHIAPSRNAYKNGDILVDLTRRVVTRNRQPVHLTVVEYELLKIFISHVGQTLSAEELSTALWDSDAPNKVRRLRVHISNLRSKLEPDANHSHCLLTVPSMGYRLLPSK